MRFSRIDLQAIGSSGAGLTLNGRTFSRIDLQAIAASVAAGGGQLTITDVSRFSRIDLQAIAASGKGHVTFSFENN